MEVTTDSSSSSLKYAINGFPGNRVRKLCATRLCQTHDKVVPITFEIALPVGNRDRKFHCPECRDVRLSVKPLNFISIFSMCVIIVTIVASRPMLSLLKGISDFYMWVGHISSTGSEVIVCFWTFEVIDFSNLLQSLIPVMWINNTDINDGIFL